MVNVDMRYYDFFLYGGKDTYGLPSLTNEAQGKLKMSISLVSQSVQNNPKYKDATYVGLTHASIDESYVIDFNGEKLKVLYVNPVGRYKQAFMSNI